MSNIITKNRYSKIYCCTCGKQCISYETRPWDKNITTLIGAKANFGNTVFCGHCAKDLDENGLFPEERECL